MSRTAEINRATAETDISLQLNLDGSGTASTLFAEPGFSFPDGVAIDPAAATATAGEEES